MSSNFSFEVQCKAGGFYKHLCQTFSFKKKNKKNKNKNKKKTFSFYNTCRSKGRDHTLRYYEEKVQGDQRHKTASTESEVSSQTDGNRTAA